jgi:hypothetical protein
MKKYRLLNLLAGIIILISNTSCNKMKVELLATKHLQHFPSASSIEFYNDKLYVIGDDATYLLVLDKDYTGVDSLQLFTSTTKRIAKDFKEDLEASAIIKYKGRDNLIVFGSGATEAREKMYLFPLDSLSTYKSFTLTNFYKNLRNQNIAEVNIEGAAAVNDKLIMSNRSNLSTKINKLIITAFNIFEDSTEPVHIIDLKLPARFSNAGISGLTYVPSSDLLLFTASEEVTFSAYDDGAIGNSYVGVIERFSTKLTSSSVEPTEIFQLKKVADALKLTKIESITVESVNGNEYIIHLAADNDNGESTLFKLKVNTGQ